MIRCPEINDGPELQGWSHMNQKTIRISPSALSEIQAALKEYSAVIEASELSYASQAMYIDFADCFVRWTRSDFEPGALKGRRPLQRQDVKTISASSKQRLRNSDAEGTK
jgi:hypothetical protein